MQFQMLRGNRKHTLSKRSILLDSKTTTLPCPYKLIEIFLKTKTQTLENYRNFFSFPMCKGIQIVPKSNNFYYIPSLWFISYVPVSKPVFPSFRKNDDKNSKFKIQRDYLNLERWRRRKKSRDFIRVFCINWANERHCPSQIQTT